MNPRFRQFRCLLAEAYPHRADAVPQPRHHQDQGSVPTGTDSAGHATGDTSLRGGHHTMNRTTR